MPAKYTLPESDENGCDAIVYIAIRGQSDHAAMAPYLQPIGDYRAQNKCAEDAEPALIALPVKSAIRFVIYSATGPLNRDFDDVTRFQDAAHEGVKKAIQCGARKPTVILSELIADKLPKIIRQSIPCHAAGMIKATIMLSAYKAAYTPLEIREAMPTRSTKLDSLTFHADLLNMDTTVRAIEEGRALARDIGGSDPERMSAPNVARHVLEMFTNSVVKVEVCEDQASIVKNFPCLAAVNRGSNEKHQARVIWLTYEPEDEPERTLVLVGKGVTYDTGGHDIKAGGHMAGMHRDKCGAAAVAGFFQTLALLRPKGVRVLGAMAMVRNSVGPDAYVSDELITARSGVRLRVGNTDAEGRMAMVDVLCYLREKVLREKLVNPQFFTIATLTGHACLAVGGEYSIIIDNGPARADGVAKKVQKAGDRIGDLFEVSTVRREDYEFNKGKSEYEDILQANNAPSSQTPRGHQIPAAFLTVVSGLDGHGLDAEFPLPYSHIDIASSSGPFPGIPTGAPIAALTLAYCLKCPAMVKSEAK